LLSPEAENRSLVRFDNGDMIRGKAETDGIRFLLLSGIPPKELVAWYGPIVRSTQAELRQAFQELQADSFLHPPGAAPRGAEGRPARRFHAKTATTPAIPCAVSEGRGMYARPGFLACHPVLLGALGVLGENTSPVRHRYGPHGLPLTTIRVFGIHGTRVRDLP